MIRKFKSKKHFEKRLFGSFRDLFASRFDKSCIISNGVKCRSGWFWFVYNLSEEINNYLDKQMLNYKLTYKIIDELGIVLKEYKSYFEAIINKIIRFNNCFITNNGLKITGIYQEEGLLKVEFDIPLHYSHLIKRDLYRIVLKYSKLSENVCSECGSYEKTSNLKGDLNNIYNMCDICWLKFNKDKKFGELYGDKEARIQRIH